MRDVGVDFFDDFYLQVCAAIEDKSSELERKLESDKKESNQNILRTYRQSARDKIEDFKIIEIAKKNGQPILDMDNSDNIRYSKEFINVGGIMVERPFLYKKTYAEVRAENRKRIVGGKLTGLASLYVENCEHLSLSMAYEDFYWAQFQFESGDKKGSCSLLLDAFYYIDNYMTRSEDRASSDYHRLMISFDRACKKNNSSIGGKNKLTDLEYMKELLVTILRDITPREGWRTKRQVYENLIPYLCEEDKKVNPARWEYDTGNREETIRGRLVKWFSCEFKEMLEEFMFKRK